MATLSTLSVCPLSALGRKPSRAPLGVSLSWWAISCHSSRFWAWCTWGACCSWPLLLCSSAALCTPWRCLTKFCWRATVPWSSSPSSRCPWIQLDLLCLLRSLTSKLIRKNRPQLLSLDSSRLRSQTKQAICLPSPYYGTIGLPLLMESIWPHSLTAYWGCLTTSLLLHSSQASFR